MLMCRKHAMTRGLLWCTKAVERSATLVPSSSGGADGFRASEVEHSVEDGDGDPGFDLLGRPGVRAQGVADDALVSTSLLTQSIGEGFYKQLCAEEGFESSLVLVAVRCRFSWDTECEAGGER